MQFHGQLVAACGFIIFEPPDLALQSCDTILHKLNGIFQWVQFHLCRKQRANTYVVRTTQHAHSQEEQPPPQPTGGCSDGINSGSEHATLSRGAADVVLTVALV